MKLHIELFAISPPVKKGVNVDEVDFAEMHTPTRLQHFPADFSSIDGALRPVQELVNAVS